MNLQERLQAAGPKRILSLDGGGIRGALTLGFLEKIEKILQERHENPNLRLCDYFDLIGGTSTGSIIAAGLSIGMKASEIKEMYLELGDIIFGKKRGLIGTFLKGAQFDFQPLEKALRGTFDEITMGDEDIQTGLCIVAKRADTLSTWPVINHPGGKYFKYNQNIKLWQMVRASSAAPTYFIPVKLDVGDMEQAVFIDGGVSMANNPAFQLFLVATLQGFPFRWPVGEDNLFLLSIGTGNSSAVYDPEEIYDKNLLGWAKYLPDLFMRDANDMNQTILQYLSDSPTAVEIDSEIGSLGGDLLHGQKALSYVRYNVAMGKEELAEFGLHYTEEEVHSLIDMANADNRFELAKIGEAAAAQQVKPEHIPHNFDLNKQPPKEVVTFKKGEVPDLDFQKAVKKPIAVRCYQMDKPFEVDTLEGTLRGKPGDYLMVGVNGEMYPISKEIFEKTYDIQ